MKRLTILLIALLATASIRAQGDSTLYRYPLDLEPLYSAGFAEMRPNHFHSGVDLKTEGVEGHPLFSIADGEVVRIGVQPGGYGRVLYIQHPDGNTSVYAHMQRFAEPIERFVQAERYRLRRNLGDFYPAAGQFRVKRGEQIGKAGNSGSSGGPHVHFEVRKTATQETQNVIVKEMIPAVDDIAPLIMRVHYIEVDTVRGVAVNAPRRTLGVKRVEPTVYTAASEDAFGVGQKGYFVLEASDRRNNVSNTFGLYRVTARIDGEVFYEYRMDGFTFDLSRYCNAVSYYPIKRNSRNEVFRLAQLDGNIFPYKQMHNRGIITTTKGQQRTIEIECEDECQNISRLTFTIEGRGEEASFRAKVDSTALVASNRATFSHSADGLSIRIPAGALYEPIFYTQTIDSRLNSEMVERNDSTLLVLSDIYEVGDPSIPLQKSARITIRGFVPENLRRYTTIAGVGNNGGLWYAGGRYRDGAASRSTRSFGRYCLVADLEAPTIVEPFASGADMSKTKSVAFRLRDNFSGVNSVVLTIDGKWAPWDRKSSGSPIVHTFDDERFGCDRTHTMRLTVTDGVGNTTVWEAEYYR